MDAWLLGHKPRGWQVVGMRKRTLVTRFGEVTFRRRLHRDETGGIASFWMRYWAFQRIKRPVPR
ncbi:MAG: hypothetical protein GXO36_02460 [Chloroflexi bacterium]|nr:hypothetical protein [Chloroflexota bacterium]